MLEEITSCELRTIRQISFLRKALLYFLVINGAVYLLNHYLFKAEIIKFFFGEVHIGPNNAQIVFYGSIIVAFVYIVLFFISVKKVFSFYSTHMAINFQLRWLDFEERESFISKVEDAKNKLQQQLYGHNKNE